MRYSAFTENNGVLHLSAHAYDQRYIYVYGTVRSLWLDAFAMAGYGSVSDLFGSAFVDQTPFLNTSSL